MRCFKVMRRDYNENLTSFLSREGTPYHTIYKEGVKNIPYGLSKFFCFPTKEDCINFLDVEGRILYEIWEIEAENARPFHYVTNIIHMDRFWEFVRYNMIEKFLQCCSSPNNTYICDSVTLIKKV